MSQQINLYNPAFARRSGGLNAANMAWSCGAVFLALALFYGYRSYRLAFVERQVRAAAVQLADEQARLTQIAGATVRKQKNPQLEAEIGKLEMQVKLREEIMETLKSGAFGNTEGYAEYLRAFARQIADGLWLTGFTIVGAGVEMAIHGKALQPEQVPAYLRRLNQERVIQGRAFAGMQMRTPQPAAADAKEKSAKAVQPPVIEFSLFSAGADDIPKM